MTGLSFPDLSVQISQRRWRCVLDPNLALSPNGAAFARRLAPHAEVWIGSEFFNILDSALIYEHEPELLGTSRAAIETVPEVLRDWTRLRDETGYGGGLFHWIGDILRESCLPNGMDEGIIAHWEAAARSLDLRLPQALEASGPLIAAMRDTVALCAILPAAAILTLRAPDEPRESPVLCRNVQCWGLDCQHLSGGDKLAAIECHSFRQVLVQAGLAKFVWGGLKLAVLHLLASGLTRLDTPQDSIDEAGADLVIDARENAAIRWDPWHDAKGYWYDLVSESDDA